MHKSRVILPILSLTLLLGSCGSLKEIPVKEEVTYRVVDSVVWHDTTVYNYINKEKIVDIVPIYDTLILETNVAKATSYVDTLSKNLKGTIENKNVKLPTEIKWKERIVRKDSLVIKEVPVEVTKEVTKYPRSYWYLLTFTILSILLFLFKLYLKFIK